MSRSRSSARSSSRWEAGTGERDALAVGDLGEGVVACASGSRPGAPERGPVSAAAGLAGRRSRPGRAPGRPGDAGQCLAQGRGGVPVTLDRPGPRRLGAAGDAHRAEPAPGLPRNHSLTVPGRRRARLRALCQAAGVRVAPGFAAAEDQQVRDTLGPAAACWWRRWAAGRPRRGPPGRPSPGGRPGLGVHRVAAGHHRDQAAGPDQVEALDDEVVVDASAAARVVPPVVVRRGVPNGTLPMARSK